MELVIQLEEFLLKNKVEKAKKKGQLDIQVSKIINHQKKERIEKYIWREF